jgi:outer membrane receptor for ferrienterochelin and colicins
MKKKVLSLFCFSVILSNTGTVFSGEMQRVSLDSLLQLSLEELIEIPVTASVASSREEPIIFTPAIVSSYVADDMAQFGLRTLSDILSFIPGVIVQDGLNGNTQVMIRGISEGFNQKVLFILDEVPYWMTPHGDMPLLGIPIEGIEKVEVIRGPGAVYYGTNASGGVIKVVTRKSGKSRVAVASGSNNFFNTGGYLQHAWGDSKFSVSYEYQNDEGYEGYLGGTDSIPVGKVNKQKDIESILASYEYKDFRLLGSAFHTVGTGVAERLWPDNENDLEYDSYLISAHQKISFDEADVRFFADYNRYYLQFYTDNYLGNPFDGGFRFDEHDENYRFRGGMNVDYSFSPTVTGFFGGEYEKRSTGNYEGYNDVTDATMFTILPGFAQEEYSLYGQMDILFFDDLRVVAGGRYTNNKDLGDQFTPRVSAVYRLDNSQSIKLLYSEGFNTPSLTQQGADMPPVIVGNSNLDAETMETVDLAYSRVTPTSMFVANVFYLHAQDFILKDRSSGTIHFFNAGNFERWGGELDFKYSLNGTWSFLANLAYHYQGDDRDEDYASAYVPVLTTSWGISWNRDNHQIGASLRTIGERAESNSYEQLNLNYQYSQDNWQFYLTLRNVMGDEILNPNIGDFQDRELPGDDDFNFLAGAKYSF